MSNSKAIVCPHCETVNQVASHRLSNKTLCGHCNQVLFNYHPIHLTDDNFELHISQNDIPVLVYFWAPWCGPCKTMIPMFKHITEELEPKIRLTKINTEQETLATKFYNIHTIPTILLFQKGKEIARYSGIINAEDLQKWVQSALEKLS